MNLNGRIATSRYFRALFTNQMNEGRDGQVHIREIDSAIMKLLIGISWYSVWSFIKVKITIFMKRMVVHKGGDDRFGQCRAVVDIGRSISNDGTRIEVCWVFGELFAQRECDGHKAICFVFLSGQVKSCREQFSHVTSNRLGFWNTCLFSSKLV